MAEITPEQFVAWGEKLGALHEKIEIAAMVNNLTAVATQTAKIDGIAVGVNIMQQSVEGNTKEVGELRTALEAVKKSIDDQTAVEKDSAARAFFKNPWVIGVGSMLLLAGGGAMIYKVFGPDAAESGKELLEIGKDLAGPPSPSGLTP